MKKNLFSIALAAFAVCASITVTNAQVKEATITYSVTPQLEMELPPEYAAAMQGIESVTYMKGDKFRTDFTSAFNNATMVVDGKGNSVSLVSDPMGRKFCMRKKAEGKKKDKKGDKKEEKKPKITVKYENETKTIAGYECKKAIVETVRDTVKSTAVVWYTDKIAVPGKDKNKEGMFGDLKGFPMEFERDMGLKMKFTAVQVSTAAVPDSKFEVSTEGYTEVANEEEMRKAIMAGGGQ